MEMKIKYEDLIARCEQLSSFESEGKVDAAGQSRYLEIHINEVDKLLIQQYIAQARGILEERMERMILSSDSTKEPIYELKEKPETSDFFPFVEKIYGSSLATIDVRDNKAAPTEYLSDIYYLDGGEYNKFAISNGHGTYYTHRDDVGEAYILGMGRKLYKDKNGNKYVSQGRGLQDYEPLYERVVVGYHDGFKWSLRTDTRWKQNNSLAKHVSEAIVSYTMSAWLSDKLPERVAFYDTLFTASTEMAVKNIFKKQAPRYEE
jgi:hypothetical protein